MEEKHTSFYIGSRKNNILKETAKLLSSREVRREKGLFLAEGARLCRDAARSGVKIEELFYTDTAACRYDSYLSEIKPAAEKIYRMADHAGELLVETKSTQGIFCVCRMHDNRNEEIPQRHCLALENIQDPGNLGTILRTAEALGLGCVLLCGDCCDMYAPKVLRSSMGAVFRLPVFSFASLPSAVKTLSSRGFQSFAAVPEAGALSVTRVDFSAPSLIAVGNEGNGLSREGKEACGRRVTIPMLGRAESLNAAASASILMWEMMREGGGYGAG